MILHKILWKIRMWTHMLIPNLFTETQKTANKKDITVIFQKSVEKLRFTQLSNYLTDHFFRSHMQEKNIVQNKVRVSD
jgi:hypothetical protein